MDNQDRDLLSLSPTNLPHSILKSSCADNFILLQTPVHKNLKVSFQTPVKPPLILLQRQMTPLANKSNISVNTNWNDLRELDDELRWRERMEVVTKVDHEDYTNLAREFINDIITKISTNRNHHENADSELSNGGDTTTCTQSNFHSPLLESNRNTCLSPQDETDKENTQPVPAKCIRLQKQKSSSKNSGSFNSIPISMEAEIASSFSTEVISTTNESHCGNNSTSAEDLPLPIQPCNVVSKPDAYNTICQEKITDEVPVHQHSPEKETKGLPVKTEEDALSEYFQTTVHFTSSELERCRLAEAAKDAPPQHIDDVPHEAMFQDAANLVAGGFNFDLDYLENKGNDAKGSDLRKQSLYLKFDPLVGGDDNHAARSLIGRKSDIIDLNGHVGLPLPREEPIKSEKVDLLFDSPSKLSSAMEGPVVATEGGMVAMEGGMVAMEGEVKEGEVVQVLKYSESDVERLKKPLFEQIAKLQEEVTSFQAEMTAQDEQRGQMQVVLEEFEATVMEMTNKHTEEVTKLEQEKEEVSKENTKMLSHLESVEKAYLDLLQRCEQMKEGIGNYKVNEETYKKVFAEYKAAQEASHQRYERLKATMEENQQRMQTEFEAKEKEFQSQNTGLKARCKFLENQAKSLQSQLQQKSNENQELTKICDELIDQQRS